ncbi:hypothetical protein AVEN_98700-1 [Araneus ventricosus]|uniref:Uncharacterized protein n=1 Tax=Araneus ventricosus TaxID=182803 RepID=A0A4Y2TTN8_ARAVE|nr:hypothetical protein AVEN_98700-1 [Araneus ventricosus]
MALKTGRKKPDFQEELLHVKEASIWVSKNNDSHENCEVGGENKHTGRDMEDSWLGNNGVEDSGMDKDYVPNSDARLKDNCLSQTDRDKLIAEYDLHLTESARRYTIKSEDIKMSKTSPTHKVLTGDQQKCLPTPLLINRISFCKRKLWTLNYALLDSSDESVHCMLRYESKPVRGCEEISSVVLKWAESVTPTSDVNEITTVR